MATSTDFKVWRSPSLLRSILASGPIGYWIGRRLWLLALPMGLLALVGLGVLIADIT